MAPSGRVKAVSDEPSQPRATRVWAGRKPSTRYRQYVTKGGLQVGRRRMGQAPKTFIQVGGFGANGAYQTNATHNEAVISDQPWPEVSGRAPETHESQ